MKSIIATGNWTIAGPDGIPENPHASGTLFEATKQALNPFCYPHYLFHYPSHLVSYCNKRIYTFCYEFVISPTGQS